MSFRERDRVVTPSDEVAFVESVRADGYVHLRYQGALSDVNAGLTLAPHLLVRWEHEKPRPKPVRVAWVWK